MLTRHADPVHKVGTKSMAVQVESLQKAIQTADYHTLGGTSHMDPMWMMLPEILQHRGPEYKLVGEPWSSDWEERNSNSQVLWLRPSKITKEGLQVDDPKPTQDHSCTGSDGSPQISPPHCFRNTSNYEGILYRSLCSTWENTNIQGLV